MMLFTLLTLSVLVQPVRLSEVVELPFQASADYPNPFVDVRFSAEFTHATGTSVTVEGFFDGDGAGGQQGRRFLVRVCPELPGRWSYRTRSNDRALDNQSGSFDCVAAEVAGPVGVDPQQPRRFVYRFSGQPFVHLGFTAYHLLDPSNDAATVRRTIDYCAQNGFNKVRFLIAGYPRDDDRRKPQAVQGEFGVPGQRMRLTNYGCPPGELNPLPAWLGKPHRYDFSRFHLAYWHKLEDAVRYMRRQGIVACCIFTIEKQNLPNEYGALTEHEKRFYRYAVARLAAFDNVWWDLGNEHNEYRDRNWAPTLGKLVKQWDPYDRLLSVHGYAEWVYGSADWADFLITQQYGTPQAVNAWVLKYRDLAKPYVNEEYGYEGKVDRPGHEQNADWVRRCHWAIALAGGYATYGDWGPRAGFYIGEPDTGVAAGQLRHLRSFIERFGFASLEPANERLAGGFCQTDGRNWLIGYVPAGGNHTLDLTGINGPFSLRWYDPRSGRLREPTIIEGGKPLILEAPSTADWALALVPPDDED